MYLLNPHKTQAKTWQIQTLETANAKLKEDTGTSIKSLKLMHHTGKRTTKNNVKGKLQFLSDILIPPSIPCFLYSHALCLIH